MLLGDTVRKCQMQLRYCTIQYAVVGSDMIAGDPLQLVECSLNRISSSKALHLAGSDDLAAGAEGIGLGLFLGIE